MRATVMAVFAAATTLANCQTHNIDFGTPGTTPSAAFRAAGFPGAWNQVAHLPAGQRQDLVGLDGVPSGARIYQIGLSSVQTFNHPGTTGDHEAFIDDYGISTNSPVDGCVWVENLQNGIYDVYIYAIAPQNQNLLSQTRVDNSTPGPLWVGGVWSGGYVTGNTHAIFRVTVTNGVIGLHSGIFGSNLTSVINGFQIVKVDGPPMMVHAESLTILSGQHFGGGIAETLYSDDQKLFVLNDESDPVSSVRFDSAAPTRTPSVFRIKLEHSATRSDLAIFADQFDVLANSFINMGVTTSSITDTVSTFPVVGDPMRFLYSSFAFTNGRVRAIPTEDLIAEDGWSLAIDQFGWEMNL